MIRSEKLYMKFKNMILRKCDLKSFSQKISIFGFQRKYEESIVSNILMQIWVSSDDSTSNYGEKCKRYATNRNQNIQSHQYGRQTLFLYLLYNWLRSRVVLPAHRDCNQTLVRLVQTFLRSILEIFKKYFLKKFWEFFEKFREVFPKISKIILKNFEKYFGKININFKILSNNLTTH